MIDFLSTAENAEHAEKNQLLTTDFADFRTKISHKKAQKTQRRIRQGFCLATKRHKELRVASYGLRVTSCGLRKAFYGKDCGFFK